jgi:hypothetical protein
VLFWLGLLAPAKWVATEGNNRTFQRSTAPLVYRFALSFACNSGTFHVGLVVKESSGAWLYYSGRVDLL